MHGIHPAWCADGCMCFSIVFHRICEQILNYAAKRNGLWSTYKFLKQHFILLSIIPINYWILLSIIHSTMCHNFQERKPFMPTEERRQKAYKWENFFCVILKSIEFLEIEKGVVSYCSIDSCPLTFQVFSHMRRGIGGRLDYIACRVWPQLWELLVFVPWRHGVGKGKTEFIFFPKRIVIE